MRKNLTSRRSQLMNMLYVLFISALVFVGTISLDRVLQSYLTENKDAQASALETLPNDDTNHSISSLKTLIPTTTASYTEPKEEPKASEAIPETTENALHPEAFEEELLWLARGILSETKRPEEMELVAWVIRNRVETKYRGKTTYKQIILDPYQFSAFNPGYPKKSYYMGLTRNSNAKGWKNALRIASDVLTAPSSKRPFHIRTRHFYSEQSMVGRSEPVWVAGKQNVSVEHLGIPTERFRFYRDNS